MKVLGIFAIVSVTLISVGLMQPVSSQAMCAGDKTLEDQYQVYDYIFSGKVSEIQPNPVRGKITLTVYEMWKGQPSESITILSGVGESDYSIPFEIGNSYLVFASKLVFDEPVTSGCSPTKPLINASNEIEFLNTKTESKTINFQYPAPGSSIVANLYSLKTQIEYGLSYDQLRCNEGHVLIQKYDGSPACVTESTKTKLVERGWTTKDSSAQEIIERLKQNTPPVNEVDARYIETLALMNQTVSNFVYGIEWTSHCCGYSENNGSYEITITFLDSDNRRQLGVTIDLDTMQITDIQHGGAVSIGKGLDSESDPYMLVALREFPNESAYYHKLNSISEIPYLSEINENKTTIITSEQFNDLLGWFPQKCLENNSDSYNCSDTPPIFEHESAKYLIVSHELDSAEVYCESGLLYVVNYEKEFPDRKLDDFVPAKC